MKFESKFGIGEIVVIHANVQNRRGGSDYLGEIFAITFGKDGDLAYQVEVQYPAGMQRMSFAEHQLEGDPLFDQDTGCYPEGDDDE